jgi:3-dehydroquinate dehydratase
MNDHRPAIARTMDKVTIDKLHDSTEKMCIPDFDWLNQPVVAIVDGLVHIHYPHLHMHYPHLHIRHPHRRAPGDNPA